MRFEWLIIDGYNVLHTQPHLVTLMRSDMEQARHQLVRHIEAAALAIADQVTLVFDGKERGRDESLSRSRFEVVYASKELSADGLIERLVDKATTPERICVITSDTLEQRTVSGSGAHTMSAHEFMNQLNKQHKSTTYSTQMRPAQKPKLGDIFPDSL
jgi:predicted RNA-binding protein with PIN domain